MKQSREPLIAALAIGLLAGSSVAVAAQEAPVEFTAEWAFGDSIRSGERVVDEGVTRWQGEVWSPEAAVEATDPRFVGDVTNSWNHDDYEDGSNIGAVTFTVRNDEGAWLMQPHLTLNFPGSGPWPVMDVVFVGEGAYDGLLALVNIVTTSGVGWDLHGYIVDESALPTLEPYQP